MHECITLRVSQYAVQQNQGIKFLRLQILVSRKIPVWINGGVFIMKATGIVRRIDPCVIIGQNLKDRRNTRVFADFVQSLRLVNSVVFRPGMSESEVRC